MMSLTAMSLGLKFCMSRKAGRGGGGWVHLNGANSMAASLVFRSNLVGTGRAISIHFGINGVRNKRSHFVRPPFPEFKACFSATAFVGVVTVTYLLSMAEITFGSSFEPNNPTEQKLRYF